MTPKSQQPNCKYCWDKGYYTQLVQTIYHADFVGDKTYADPPEIKKVPCPKCQVDTPVQQPKEKWVDYKEEMHHLKHPSKPIWCEEAPTYLEVLVWLDQARQEGYEEGFNEGIRGIDLNKENGNL